MSQVLCQYRWIVLKFDSMLYSWHSFGCQRAPGAHKQHLTRRICSDFYSTCELVVKVSTPATRTVFPVNWKPIWGLLTYSAKLYNIVHQ